MKFESPVFSAIQQELYDWRLWAGRGVVLAFAALAGLTVVAFTWMTEQAIEHFVAFEKAFWWGPMLWIPASTAAIVWLTRRFAPGAAGSGIPQVMAALTPEVSREDRSLFVSIRLTVAKMLLTSWGMLAGLSLGREGPSVQIAAGVMHHARRWLPQRSQISDHGLMMAGGAAGIAAAFNTPLGGVMFAIEELSRRPEQRSSGLLAGAFCGRLRLGHCGVGFGQPWRNVWQWLHPHPQHAGGQRRCCAFLCVAQVHRHLDHALVLSLMATALVASGVSRLISPPFYTSLAELQLQRLPPKTS
jgi:H+/Cl- antiporter ClcA